MLSGYTRGQLAKEAAFNWLSLGRNLLNLSRLATYGGGPWAERIATATKFLQRSPIAYQAARQGLMFGSFGGTANVILGALTGDQTPWYERYIRGFIPSAIGGAAWGATQTGFAKALSKLYQAKKPIQGFRQRVGAWGARTYQEAANETRLAVEKRFLTPKQFAKKEEKLNKRLRKQFGPTFLGSVKEKGIPFGERVARFGTSFGLGGLSIGLGMGASSLAEKLSPISSEYPTTPVTGTYQTVRRTIPGSYMYGFHHPTPRVGWPGMSDYY